MIPSYLFHYTTVDALLLILNNNTIRFKRLDLMNDPLEGYLQLFENSRKYVFSSSWSAQSIDEIPMWKMYHDLKGVRLRMPIDLFDNGEQMKVKKMNRSKSFLIKSELDKEYFVEFEPPINSNGENISKFKIKSVFGPTMVEYYSNHEIISNDIIRKMDYTNNVDFYEIDLNIIGQRKIDYWSFEKEYRFRLFINDAIMLAGSDNVLTEFHNDHTISTKYLDVKFKKNSLNGVEIILGPKTNENDKIKIESALRDIGIDEFEIKKSKIKIQ